MSNQAIYTYFYPGDEVEIVANAEAGTPGLPGKIRTDPYSACLTRLSEKECKKSLPKYAFGSREESAYLIRQPCTEQAIKESSNPIENGKICLEWVAECKTSWNIDKKMCELHYEDNLNQTHPIRANNINLTKPHAEE